MLASFIAGYIVFVMVFDDRLLLRLECGSVQLALVEGKDHLAVTEHIMPFGRLRLVVGHPKAGLCNLSNHFWEQFLYGSRVDYIHRRPATRIGRS